MVGSGGGCATPALPDSAAPAPGRGWGDPAPSDAMNKNTYPRKGAGEGPTSHRA